MHLVFNNGSHDSVGGSPPWACDDMVGDAGKACGYRLALSVSTAEELESAMRSLPKGDGPVFLEVKVNGGARPDLGRPKTSPKENRDQLMANLRKEV